MQALALLFAMTAATSVNLTLTVGNACLIETPRVVGGPGAVRLESVVSGCNPAAVVSANVSVASDSSRGEGWYVATVNF